MRTHFKRFAIAPASGAVTDRATGREVGSVRADGNGCWHGTAHLPDGREYPVGPWLTAFAAADSVHMIATAVQQRDGQAA